MLRKNRREAWLKELLDLGSRHLLLLPGARVGDSTYAISMTPVAFCLEELLPLHPAAPSFQTASLLIRTALVVSTVAVALLVPFFGYVMAFIGSFLSMTVSVMLPCACYLRLMGKNVTVLERLVCHIAIVFGFVCAVAGTYSSVRGILASWGS